MAKETTYEVWYDARDGVRRHLKANTKAAVQEVIADLRADDDQHVLLGKTVGIHVAPRELNIEVLKTVSETTKVDV
jgi:hypothetical protein